MSESAFTDLFVNVPGGVRLHAAAPTAENVPGPHPPVPVFAVEPVSQAKPAAQRLGGPTERTEARCALEPNGSDDSFHRETTGIHPPKEVVFGVMPLFVGSAFTNMAAHPARRKNVECSRNSDDTSLHCEYLEASYRCRTRMIGQNSLECSA